MKQGTENTFLEATEEKHIFNTSVSLGYRKICLVAAMKHPAQIQPAYSMAL